MSIANQIHNCESIPIYQAAGPVIDSVSCMPLHLSLQLGKQALEQVESEAISLDKTIKEANDEASPELVEAFQKRDELVLECASLEELLEDAMKPLILLKKRFRGFLTRQLPIIKRKGKGTMCRIK